MLNPDCYDVDSVEFPCKNMQMHAFFIEVDKGKHGWFVVF